MPLGALRQQLRILFILLIIVQAGFLAFSYGRIKRFAAERSEERHIASLRTELLALRGAAMEAETGQLGFVITGREEFLQPYRASVLTFTSRLDRLSALAFARPTFVPKLAQITTLLKAVQEEMARLVVVRRLQGFDAVQQQLLDGTQRERMNELRAMIADLDEEAERQAQAEERAERRASSTLIAMTFFTLCGGLLLIASLAFFILNRLSMLASSLGKPLVEVTRELRSESRAVVRDIAKLTSLAKRDAMAKAEGQATLEVVTRMAKDLSTLAMEITSSVRELDETPPADVVRTEAALIERLVSLSGRVAQSALSIELTATEHRRLFDGSEVFLSALETSVDNVGQTASRVKKLAKDLLQLVQSLTEPTRHQRGATSAGAPDVSATAITLDQSDVGISPTGT